MDADAPFVAAPVGDEAAARLLAARLAAALDAPPPALIRAGMNASYRAGDLVIRVGRPTADPAAAYELADALRAAGVRVPAPAAGAPVEHDGAGMAATAWEFVTGGGAPAWTEVGRMAARVHDLAPDEVATRYPTPPATALPWWRFDEVLDKARPLLDQKAADGLAAAIERHGDWPERSAAGGEWVLCHGDIHHHNVVFTSDGPVLLDWDLLCLAPPGWDHAPLRAMVARWGLEPAVADDFARGYGALPADAGVTDSLTELRAVAATLLRVLAEGPDRGDDSEAERRLRYWRGDPDPPTWRFV
jgi:Ser/Thr protein kinase RdoA (MazF antagonist)